MTVIRAPSDDDVTEEKAQVEEAGSVAKAVGKGIKYIRRVFGSKPKRRKRVRPPPGFKPSRNPFFNYLRYLQVELRGMSAAEVAQEGGRRWGLMSDKDKEPYRKIARCARPPRSKAGRRSSRHAPSASPRAARARSGSRSRSRGRSRDRSPGRSPSRSRSRARC